MSVIRSVLPRKVGSVNADLSPNMPGSRITEHVPIAMVIGLFLLVAVLVRPFGNYPAHDDAGYGLAVFRLVREGHFEFPTWAAMTMVTQLVYGTAACALLGCSFLSLHISSLIVSLAGIVAVYLLVLEIGMSKNVAALAAASIALNPIYFALSLRYISDMPHFVCLLFGTWLFARNANRKKLANTPGITIMSVLAVLTRQCGMCMPVAIFFTNLFGGRTTVRRVLSGAVPATASALCLLAFDYWRTHSGHHSLNYKSLLELTGNDTAASLPHVISRLLRVIPLYCGFFLGPIGVSIFCGYWRGKRLVFSSIAGAGLLYCMAIFLTFHPMPACPDVLDPDGLSPKVLSVRLPEIAPWIRWCLTWLCSVSLFSMVYETAAYVKQRALKGSAETIMFVYAALLGAVYLLSVLRLHAIFDRYVLPLAIPCLILLLANKPIDRMRTSVGWIAVLFLSLLTFFSAFNYYSYSSACWNLIRIAVCRGVQPANINGGFECNLLFSKEPHGAAVVDWNKWCRHPDAVVDGTSASIPGFSKSVGVQFPCVFGAPQQMWLSLPDSFAGKTATTSAPQAQAELKYFGIFEEQPVSAGSRLLTTSRSRNGF